MRPFGLVLFIFFWLSIDPPHAIAALPDSLVKAIKKPDSQHLWELQIGWINALAEANYSTKRLESMAEELVASAQLEHEALQADYFFCAGLFYENLLENVPMALEQYDWAFKTAKTVDNRKMMAAALWQSMSALARLQLYEQALQYLFRVEAVLQEYNYNGFESLAVKMLEMGAVFFNTANYQVAIQYYEKAFTFKGLENDKKSLMYAYNTLGLAYQRIADFDPALKRFSQSHALAKEIGDQFWEALTFGNMGAIYFEQGKYALALDHLFYDIEVSNRLGVWNSAANACVFVARIYKRQANYALATAYLDTALTLHNKAPLNTTRLGIYEQYADVFTQSGDYAQALHYYTAARKLADSIQTEVKAREHKVLLQKHRFELQDQKRLWQENQQKLTKHNHYAALMLMVAALILLIVLIAWYFDRKKLLNISKQNKEDIRKNFIKKELQLIKKELDFRLNWAKRFPGALVDVLPNPSFWESMKLQYDELNDHFSAKTKANHPEINGEEILLLMLLRMKFSFEDACLLCGFEDPEKQRMQLRKKLGLRQHQELELMVESL